MLFLEYFFLKIDNFTSNYSSHGVILRNLYEVSLKAKVFISTF